MPDKLQGFWVYVQHNDGWRISLKPLHYHDQPATLEPLVFECDRSFPSQYDARDYAKKLFGEGLDFKTDGDRLAARVDFHCRPV